MKSVGIRQTTQDLLDWGPSLPVQVALIGSDTFVDAIALVDTGADGCAMTETLLERLGGKVTSTVTVHEAGREPMDFGALEATLQLPKLPKINVPFGVLPSFGSRHDILLGRHFFRGGKLLVDYEQGRFEMHFPTMPE